MGNKGARNPLNLKQNTSAEQAQELVRAQLAVAAVLRGMNYEQAAQAAGYANKSGAYKAVHRHLAEVSRELSEDSMLLRAKLIAQLDRAMVEITALAFKKETPADVKLRALEALRRNVETRAKITGAMAPIQHEVINLDALDRTIADLAARLGIPVPDDLSTIIDGFVVADGRGGPADPGPAALPAGAAEG